MRRNIAETIGRVDKKALAAYTLGGLGIASVVIALSCFPDSGRGDTSSRGGNPGPQTKNIPIFNPGFKK